MGCFEVILGLEEGDFGSKNGTREGMEVGWWRKELMGWGFFRLFLFM